MTSYTDYPQHGNDVIVVKTSEELNAALQTLTENAGGTILMDGRAGPFNMRAIDVGSAETPILVTSLDPEIPAVMEQGIVLRGSHLSFTEFRVDSGELGGAGDLRADHQPDFNVVNSGYIEIVDMDFHSNGEGVWQLEEDAVLGEEGLILREVENALVSGNTFSNHYQAITLSGVTHLEISNNEMFALQGDGIRGGGLQHVVITENYMHDFIGSANFINHADMIQIWNGGPENRGNFDIEISSNILDAGSGRAAQAILIQNEVFYVDGHILNGVYNEDIRIFDNLIHNGLANGIGLLNVKDTEIYNNTLLWNENAVNTETVDDEDLSWPPIIIARDSINVSATNNVASEVNINGVMQNDTNYIVNYNDPFSEGYIHDHIIGLSGAGDTELSDLQFRPDSPLNESGIGSRFSNWVPSTDPVYAVLQQDATYGDRASVDLSAEFTTINGQLVDPATASFTWIFDDGAERSGLVVSHAFETPGQHSVILRVETADGLVDTTERVVNVGTNEIFETNFENGARDQGILEAPFRIEDPDNVAWTGGKSGLGLRYGENTLFEISRDTTEIHNLETFSVKMDFRPEDMSQIGTVFHMIGATHFRILPDGSLRFDLETSDGNYLIQSDAGAVEVGTWANLEVLFDGPAGTTEILVDGTVVAEGATTGTIGGGGRNLWFGNPYGTNAIGTMDNLVVSSPVSDIRENIAPDVAPNPQPPVIVDDTPVEDTPVDETPVDDTPVDDTPVDDTPVDETPQAPETPQPPEVPDIPDVPDDAPVAEDPIEDDPYGDGDPYGDRPWSIGDNQAPETDEETQDVVLSAYASMRAVGLRFVQANTPPATPAPVQNDDDFGDWSSLEDVVPVTNILQENAGYMRDPNPWTAHHEDDEDEIAWVA